MFTAFVQSARKPKRPRFRPASSRSTSDWRLLWSWQSSWVAPDLARIHLSVNHVTMTEPFVLVLEHVAVGYGRRVVLPDVNLGLRSGSFTGLLGANGSGKSTLLKTILGILPALAGRIVLQPIDGRAPVLGYMPQRE